MHYGYWRVATVFPFGLCPGLHTSPAAVLANPYAHAAQLHGPYTDHQSVAAAKALDLNLYVPRHGDVSSSTEELSRTA